MSQWDSWDSIEVCSSSDLNLLKYLPSKIGRIDQKNQYIMESLKAFTIPSLDIQPFVPRNFSQKLDLGKNHFEFDLLAAIRVVVTTLASVFVQFVKHLNYFLK